MKKKLARLMAIALSSAMGLSLTACGGSQSTTASKPENAAQSEAKAGENSRAETSGEPVTLRLSWWGGDSRHEATEKAVKAFMKKYPDITVDTEYGAWTGWEEKQSLSILSGECADVIQIGSNWVTDYSKGGESYLDLYQYSDVIDLSQFPEDKLKLNEVNGKLMAIPISLTGRLFYWNKTTFEEVGCEIPTDEASLLAAGAAFKAFNEDCYPLALGEYDRAIFMVYYLESKYGKDWIVDGKLNYTEDEIKEGMEFMTRLEEAHAIPSIATINGDMADSLDKNSKWIDGKYAGIMEWDSGVSKVKAALEGSVNKPGQEFVIGDFLKFGDYQGGSTKVSMDFAIKASTQHPKEAAMLMNFLLNDPEGVEICSTERGIPCSAFAIKHLNEKGIGDEMTKEANAKVLDYCKFIQDPQFDNSELKANPDGLYYKVFGKLSAGDITPEEAAKALYDGIAEVMEEN
ncbi:ABC transporter substrate-binding protein [Clostridium sp. Marseille-P2415]|uniref:ABC transporter substrate-binding protein n=1 Tax=Clostridium sp. Marseille-P2415 TaxID=1805471 RepID=UPI000988822D|nr:ABC transporter substrate-binding protein [Clostridium sp. Marseille-P2415]